MSDKQRAFSIRVDVERQSMSLLAALEVQMKDLREAIKLAKKQGNDFALGHLKVELAQVSEQARVARVAVKRFAEFKAPRDSVVGMRREIGRLRAEWELLSKTQREGLKGKSLTSQLRSIQNELNKTSQSIGDYRYNIGNYANSIRSVGHTLLRGAGLYLGVETIGQVLRDAAETVVAFDRQLIAVGKTSGISGEALKQFGEDAIQLSRSLRGVNIQGLLEASEIAGQLGVEGAANILKFAKVTEQLKVTSDVVSQESVRDFAKFIEISRDTVANADRLGAVVTDLGNNFATSERQIIANATEIQKATSIYNISAQAVLALGAATSALGSEAEQARSGIQRTFLVIDRAISTGEGLSEILRIIGKSEEELAKQFKTDAGGVFLEFVQGLARINAQGENLNQVFKRLELDEKRTALVLGALTANVNALDEAMFRGNSQYKISIALAEEFDAATESLASRFRDVKDAWDAFILSLESGDGPLSKLAKGGIGYFENFFNRLQAANDTNLPVRDRLNALFTQAFLPAQILNNLGIGDDYGELSQQAAELKKIEEERKNSVQGIGETLRESLSDFKDYVNEYGKEGDDYNKKLDEITKSYDKYIQTISKGTDDQADIHLKNARDLLPEIAAALEDGPQKYRFYSAVASRSLNRVGDALDDNRIERRINTINQEIEQLSKIDFDDALLEIERLEKELLSLNAALAAKRLDQEPGQKLGKRTRESVEARIEELERLITNADLNKQGNTEPVKALKKEYRELVTELANIQKQFKKNRQSVESFVEGSLAKARKDLADAQNALDKSGDSDAWEKLAKDVIKYQEELKKVEQAHNRLLFPREPFGPLPPLQDSPGAPLEFVETPDIRPSDRFPGASFLEGFSDEFINSQISEIEKALDRAEGLERKSLRGLLREYKKYLKERTKASEKAKKDEVDKRKKLEKTALDLFSKFANQLLDLRRDASKTAFQIENQRLAAQYQADLTAAGNNILLKQQLEEQYEKDRLELQKNQARERKQIALAEATVQGALAVITGFVNGNIAGAIAAGVLTATQIAIISAQEFAKGGIVQAVQPGPGKVNVAPNIPERANGDNVFATLRVGEVVLNEQHQKVLKAMAGRDIFNKMGVPGFANSGVVGVPQVTNANRIIDREVLMQQSIDPNSIQDMADAVGKKVYDSIIAANNRSDKEGTRRQQVL